MTLRRAAAAWAPWLTALLLAPGASASMSEFLGPGSGAGQVMQPTSVALTPSGNVLVGDSGNARVQTLTSSGAAVGSFTVPRGSGFDGSRLHVAAGAGGDVWVGQGGHSSGSDRVRRYSADGTLLGAWGSGYEGGPPGQITGVNGIAVDAGGNVYTAADDQNPGGLQQIIKQSPTGDLIATWPLRTADGQPGFGRAIAANGNVIAVLVAGQDTQRPEVVRFDVDGGVLSRWPVGNPVSLTLDAAGSVYTVLNSTIEKYGPDGKLLGTFDPQPPVQGPTTDGCAARLFIDYTTPQRTPTFTSLAAAGIGHVYATDLSDRVMSIDPTPDVRLAWGPGGGLGPVVTGQLVSLDAGFSTVPFGSPARFEWDLDGDGIHETDAEAKRSLAYGTAGTHAVGVRVIGSTGAAASATKALVVQDSSASIWGPPLSVTGQTVTFSAGPEIGCSTSSFTWDLDGDGTFETDTGSANRVTKVYDEVETITVRVRVARLAGRVDEATVRHETRLAPPPGPVGVTINDGAQFTNDPQVRVNPIWPPLTSQMLIANDGGLRKARSFGVSPAQIWRLDSTGVERFPKTVYVRFDRAGDRTFSDDIILDETRPRVIEASILGRRAAAAGPRVLRVRMRARDNVSGVDRMQVTAKRSRPGKWRRAQSSAQIWTGAQRLWVRVRDRAGNRSRWRSAR